MMRLCLVFTGLALLALAIVPAAGCGAVADPERLVIATVGDREVSRRAFREVLRRLPPQDKPEISSHEDMMRALQDYLDRQVLLLEAQRLADAGIIAVPDQAAENRYFTMNPEIIDVRGVMDPTLFATDEAGLEEMKRQITEGIEAARVDLLAEQALTYLVQDALATGAFTITEAEFDAAYQARREDLKDFERIWVRGLLFPILPETDGLAQRVAADARRMIDAGESMETVMGHYLLGTEPPPAAGPLRPPVPAAHRFGLPLETDIPNDPRLTQYRGLWDDIGTATVGEVIGPVHVQATERFVPGPDGRPQRETVPPSVILVELTRHEAPRPLSLNDARAQLAPRIVRDKVMARLRESHNARILEQNLPAPASYSEGPRSIMRQ